DGHLHQQEYVRGVPQFDIKVIEDTAETGTTVTFKPDSEIFTETTVSEYEILQTRIRELAFLNKGIKLTLKDERTGRCEEFQYAGGISEFGNYLSRRREVIDEEPRYVEGKRDNIQVEGSLQYSTGDSGYLYSVANSVPTHEGGTPASGFRSALTRIGKECGRR